MITENQVGLSMDRNITDEEEWVGKTTDLNQVGVVHGNVCCSKRGKLDIVCHCESTNQCPFQRSTNSSIQLQ